VGIDTSSAVACLPWLDHFAQVPPRQSPDFVDVLIRLSREHDISHIWPLSTEDQAIIAGDGALPRGSVRLCSPPGVIEIANNKIKLYEFCTTHGLPVPAYRVVHDLPSLLKTAEEFGYPKNRLVLKSATGTGAAGMKIICAGLSEEEMFLSRLNRDVTLERAAAQLEHIFPRLALMVNEYLPGEEFSVDILRYRGVWRGGVVRRRDKSLFGLATDSVVVDRPDILSLARNIADSLGLEYINNIQFRCNAEGHVMLMEINPRVPGTIGLSIAAGSNLPGTALALAAGQNAVLNQPQIGTRIIRYFGGTILRPEDD
jgi:carbamoyl-phosphate synthase large subunit